MKRDTLLAQLAAYKPTDDHEARMYQDTITFVQENPDCFERTLLKGHVTASGWVLSPDKGSVLLMHHYKLQQWFQPGGHCDGDPDTESVARKEVAEETGIWHLSLLHEGIFDVDVHAIPERKGIPEHLHYDIRYVFVAGEDQHISVNSESNDVQWIPLVHVDSYNSSESIMRMVRKVIS